MVTSKTKYTISELCSLKLNASSEPVGDEQRREKSKAHSYLHNRKSKNTEKVRLVQYTMYEV